MGKGGEGGAESRVTGVQERWRAACELIDCAEEVSYSNWTHMYACRLSRMGKNILTAA